MGLIADFFIAAPAEAIRYANRIEDPDEGEEIALLLNPVQFNGITDLEIGTLWAILERREWDIEKHMPEDMYVGEDGESWLHRFPDELTSLLANSGADALESGSEEWAETEEIDCNAADLLPLLKDLQSLARQAAATGKSIYIWGCL
ncbi:hypothetical protein [Janthinobacterium lividum]|uniref:hypothetical protein n=1 Tax=Janthinobacterium lividum TaxID=29581 RepID=UPI00140906E0|nr:hypothetical protein [Janthinobacterium lividum]NHQ91521.1 hypothetical protein [Janthinobacterium lividum]